MTNQNIDFPDVSNERHTGRRNFLQRGVALASTVAMPVIAQNKTQAIKIGLLGAISTFNGDDNRKMTRMAVEEINNMGGVLGRQIELIEVDTEGNATKSIQGLQYLYNTKKVDCVVGGYFSGPVLAIMPYLERFKLPYICTASASPKITTDGNKYVFRNWPHSVQQAIVTAKALSDILKQKHGLTNCALILEDYAWTKGEYSDVLEQKLTEHGMKVTSIIRYDPQTKDFSPIFKSAREAKSQILVPAISTDAGYTFTRQWGAMKIPMVSFGNVNASWVGDKYWDATQGNCLYSSEMGCDRPDLGPKTSQVWDKFTKMVGHPPYFTALHAYDAIYILKQAIERAGGTSSDILVTALEKTHYMGAGGTVEFDSMHQVREVALPFGQWKAETVNGKMMGVKPAIWPASAAKSQYQMPPWI